MPVLRFRKVRKDRSRYISSDGRWCVQRIVLPAPKFFIWVLLDVKTGNRYEQESLISATRIAERKTQLEAGISDLL